MVSQITSPDLGLGGLEKSGAGPVVVFLHGFPDSSHIWEPVISSMQQHCIALDLPGVGASVRADVPDFSLPSVAALLDRFLSKVNAPVYLVGHDFGAAVASVLAAVSVNRILGLTLVNGPYPLCYQKQVKSNPRQQEIIKYAEIFARPDAAEFVRRKEFAPLSTFYFDQAWMTDEDRQKSMALWQQEDSLRNALAYYRDNLPWFKEEDLSAYSLQGKRIPVGVFWGMKDHALVRENLEDMPEFIRDVSIERIADAGHWSFRSHRDAFIEFLSSRLKEVI